MPLSIPTRKGVVDSLRNYVRDALPSLDPSTERRSFIGGLVKSLGSGLADWYIALKRYADREPFPQTASSSFLFTGWWADITKLTQNPAAPASGFVVVTGTAGTVLPKGTTMTVAGTTFLTDVPATVVAQSISIIGLTEDGTTGNAKAETVGAHFLATGMTVTISAAATAAYNRTAVITVTGTNTFTYPLDVLPGVAAGGSPKVTATYAAVQTTATTTGQTTNVDSGGTLSISGAPAGIDGTARVTFGGVTGGTDLESEDSYRARVLEALGTDFGMFTADEIAIVAKQVPGVTRVMIRTARPFPAPAGYPIEGQVKVAFLRENDANPLPSAQEVADVKARIMALAMPAHTAPDDVIVMSPPPYAVNFAFRSITPDTPGMRRAIQASLTQFFRETAEWGAIVPVDQYRCAILAAYDATTQQPLKSFVLDAPTSDLVPGVDDMPVLGLVTFR